MRGPRHGAAARRHLARDHDHGDGRRRASSPDDIWAVGALLPPKRPSRTSTLAIHYDGTKWTDVSTPT
jgi:hypothetical protein